MQSCSHQRTSAQAHQAARGLPGSGNRQARGALARASGSRGRGQRPSQGTDAEQKQQELQQQPGEQQEQQQLARPRWQDMPPSWPNARAAGPRARLLAQRQAVAQREQLEQDRWTAQQLWQQQQRRDGGGGARPEPSLSYDPEAGELGWALGSGPVRQQFVSQVRQRPWYQAQRYLDPQALHAEILERSGRGSVEIQALKHLVRTAGSARDAQLALSALAAVRRVAVAHGRMYPWDDEFVKAFVQMTTACEAHEVLLSAMQRPNELGLLFKFKSVNIALKHWGAGLALDKLQALIHCVRGAGLPPDARMAYALVRACVNARDWARLDESLAWFAAQGVAELKPATESLLVMAAAQRVAEEQEAAAAAAGVAAEPAGDAIAAAAASVEGNS